MLRAPVALALSLLAVTCTAATSQAATWTPIPSGTTDTITTIDYRGGGAYWYATSTGKIFKNGSQVATFPGIPINDLAMSPDGATGVAVGDGGKIYRSTNAGATWSAVAGGAITTYPATNCSGTAGAAGALTTNLTGVSWQNATTAFVVGPDGAAPSPVLKTTNGGVTWTDKNRASSGNCLMPNGRKLTDVRALPDTSVVWFVIQSFGERYVSFDGADSATFRSGSSVNHFNGQPRIALSVAQPDRIYVVDREDDSGGLNIYGSLDSGVTFSALRHPNGNRDVPALFGVDAVGQTMLAAGSAGTILLSVDGADAYRASDTGALANVNWRAVSLLSATEAAVAGQNGTIATTTAASVIPDLVPPSGAINDPGVVKATVPVNLSAALTDNPGGSGIDTGAITWSATQSGASPVTGSGNPVSVTFPTSGFWLVTVNFKDLAGNTATATRTVTVDKAPAGGRTPTRTTTGKVPGATVKFSVPKGCVAAGSTFTVTLSWKKQKRKGNKFVKVTRTDFYIGKKRVKIDRKAPFRQTLRVTAGSKAGSTVKLKARAFIKVKKGKQPKKSLNSSIKVCG